MEIIMEWGVSSEAIDYLFTSTTANTQANMDSLAGTILGQGIDYFTKKNYDQAVKCFKQAAALSPSSNNSSKSYDYMGQAYVKLEDTDKAIKTYKEAIRLYPTNDTFHKALGDIYLKESMPDEALQEYETAVNLNPDDAETRYSLGQSYITSGELDKAKEQFAEVIHISPTSATGYYGLGQVARASGNLVDAVSQLTNAIRVNKDFELAYVELGYAYADQGELQKANDQLAILTLKSSDKTTALADYITQATQPKIVAALSPNGFNTSAGPKTKVSALNATLTEANKSKIFSMNIAFSKDMDEASIINPYNWKISRATIRDNGGVYNYGLTPSTKEAFILPKPAYVTFNTDTNTATVYFRVSQNATADATIDPKHIVFKFAGQDAYGKAMDTAADECSGFSGIA
jgi:Flp pilus assembly protein TadD